MKLCILLKLWILYETMLFIMKLCMFLNETMHSVVLYETTHSVVLYETNVVHSMDCCSL